MNKAFIKVPLKKRLTSSRPILWNNQMTITFKTWMNLPYWICEHL